MKANSVIVFLNVFANPEVNAFVNANAFLNAFVEREPNPPPSYHARVAV